MANLKSIPVGTYPAGTYQLAATNIGKTATQFEVAIDRTAFPDTPDIVASLTLEGSDDNGKTWVSLGGITLAGGQVIDRSGNVAAESIYRVTFDNSEPSSYRIRGTAVLFQQLTTGARLTVI